MSSIAAADTEVMLPKERLEVIFVELAELCGQRNAIDGRIVELVAELDHDGLWGLTGCRSVAALVAWRTGMSPANAATMATIAQRLPQFPLCGQGMRQGRLSVDQARRAAPARAAHHGGGAPRGQGAGRGVASGAVAVRRGPSVPVV